jgi:nucleotide-binding universal stress UspA family protein
MAARLPFAPGQRPKFLVPVDAASDYEAALHFAARRAERLGGSVVALAIVPPADCENWLGVGRMMEAEEAEEAQALLDSALAPLAARNISVERRILLGQKTEALVQAIADDPEICFLVVAAGTKTGALSQAPASLLVGLLEDLSALTIPLVILPPGLAAADIDALA